MQIPYKTWGGNALNLRVNSITRITSTAEITLLFPLFYIPILLTFPSEVFMSLTKWDLTSPSEEKAAPFSYHGQNKCMILESSFN